jgi:hypothetical protein
VIEIPKPELLDAGRVSYDDREDFTVEEHRSQSQMLAKALEESCHYADMLWEQLDAVRGYLLDSLPPELRSVGPRAAIGASPTGPDDEAGWQRWTDTFAATVSTLCGAHGDSGFGLSNAHDEARVRRTSLGVHREPGPAGADGVESGDVGAEVGTERAGAGLPSSAASAPGDDRSRPAWRPGPVALAALAGFVLRGVFPRRPCVENGGATSA